jgi:Flp pilus assembly protein TadG
VRTVLRGCRAAAARRWRILRADPDRGYNIMETVIIVPVIIVLTMIVVQFAMIWHGRHIAQAAAASAARSAAGYTADAARGQADAASYLGQVAPSLLTGPVVTVDRSPAHVTVTGRAQVLSVVPFGSFSVDERAVAPVEQFVGIR